MKITILDGYTVNPGDISWQPFADIGDLTIYDYTEPDKIAERIGDQEIVALNKIRLGRDQLNYAPRLRYVGLLSTGTDIIDLNETRRRKIVVANVPAYSTTATAEMTFALILELMRRAGDHNRLTHDGQWSARKNFCFWEYPQIELERKTIGIIGFGNIGRRVAQIADGFGMRVIAHTPRPTEPPRCKSFRWADLESLLAQSDIVSLHCPMKAETTKLINRERLRSMRDGAYLINVARGGLVDQEALAESLRSEKIAGAALDTLYPEPPSKNNPLFGIDRCIITPHIAWASKTARQRLIDIAADNMRSFLAGKSQNVV